MHSCDRSSRERSFSTSQRFHQKNFERTRLSSSKWPTVSRQRKSSRGSVALLACALGGTLVRCAMAAPPPFGFYNIGALPGTNFPDSSLHGISPDGSVAVGGGSGISPEHV